MAGVVCQCTGFEAFDDIFRATARGEEKDGGVAVGLAKGADDGEAVAAREHDIEDDGGGGIGSVGRCGVEEPGEGRVAVGFVVSAIAVGFEIEEQAVGEVVFVFDESDES
jgi:hypothetical protein